MEMTATPNRVAGRIHRTKPVDAFLCVGRRRRRQDRGPFLRKCHVNEMPAPVSKPIREANILSRHRAAFVSVCGVVFIKPAALLMRSAHVDAIIISSP